MKYYEREFQNVNRTYFFETLRLEGCERVHTKKISDERGLGKNWEVQNIGRFMKQNSRCHSFVRIKLWWPKNSELFETSPIRRADQGK